MNNNKQVFLGIIRFKPGGIARAGITRQLALSRAVVTPSSGVQRLLDTPGRRFLHLLNSCALADPNDSHPAATLDLLRIKTGSEVLDFHPERFSEMQPDDHLRDPGMLDNIVQCLLDDAEQTGFFG